MKILKYPLMDDEPCAAGGGAATGEGGTPAGNQSALATGGEEPKPISEQIPEKFRVFGGEDGKDFNLEASTTKLLDSYTSLEKRVGTAEAPPESPEGYKLDTEAFGEGFNVEEFMADETNKSFLAKAHAKGMTNSQVQFVVEHALKEFAPSLTQGNADLSAEDCTNTLKTDVWKTDAEYKQNMTAANRAFMSFSEDIRNEIDQRLGNDPLFLRVMAEFGREMSEDTPPAETNVTEQAKVEELMTSEAYKNPKHPQHEIVSKQVKAYFEKKHPGRAA